MDEISVHAIWLAQDDKSKNTAVKLGRRGLITLHERLTKLPRKGIILDPLCGKVLGPEDREIVANRGNLVVLLASFSWGEQFITLNQEPLEAYASAESSEELVRMQLEFFDLPDEVVSALEGRGDQ